jgi:hypothetical protein
MVCWLGHPQALLCYCRRGPEGRVEHADGEDWLKKNLLRTDYLAFGSTTNAWHVYDLLAPMAELVVANPIKWKSSGTCSWRNSSI